MGKEVSAVFQLTTDPFLVLHRCCYRLHRSTPRELPLLLSTVKKKAILAMTFYHFVNCMALACVPFHLVCKYSGLAEYGAFWKCVTAGFVYVVTQLAKMLFL